MKAYLLSILLAPALLAGCNPAKETTKAPAATGTTPPADGITNKYWKLITLEGQPVKMAPGQEREAYFMLRDSSRVTGFGGCNGIGGTYTLQAGQRIRFSNMLGTLRFCQGVESEAPFLEVFNLTDNYSLSGDTLTLNVGRRAPLAVFHAVYF